MFRQSGFTYRGSSKKLAFRPRGLRVYHLPDELILKIFKLLGAQEYLQLRLTNRRFHGITQDRLLWKCAIRTLYVERGIRPPSSSALSSMTTRQIESVTKAPVRAAQRFNRFQYGHFQGGARLVARHALATHDHTGPKDSGTWAFCPGGQFLFHFFSRAGEGLVVSAMKVDYSPQGPQTMMFGLMPAPGTHLGEMSVCPDSSGKELIVVRSSSNSSQPREGTIIVNRMLIPEWQQARGYGHHASTKIMQQIAFNVPFPGTMPRVVSMIPNTNWLVTLNTVPKKGGSSSLHFVEVVGDSLTNRGGYFPCSFRPFGDVTMTACGPDLLFTSIEDGEILVCRWEASASKARKNQSFQMPASVVKTHVKVLGKSIITPDIWSVKSSSISLVFAAIDSTSSQLHHVWWDHRSQRLHRTNYSISHIGNGTRHLLSCHVGDSTCTTLIATHSRLFAIRLPINSGYSGNINPQHYPPAMILGEEILGAGQGPIRERLPHQYMLRAAYDETTGRLAFGTFGTEPELLLMDYSRGF